MTVVTSNSSERELEAPRRAQRAHEPSMEEILASIRNIITDDRDRSSLAAPKPAPQRPVAASPGPQIVYSKDAPPAPHDEGGAPQDREVARTFAAAAQQFAAWRQPPQEPEATPDEPLMSAAASSEAFSAFEALATSVAAARAAEIAEQAVREMLRPMLKSWLEENLPEIVERLVRAEIERIVRGAR